jgi:Lrp/AsnC family transcriptional regulator, leucine-responsive regulatory protein
MVRDDLDETDRAILHLLQEDARTITTAEMADAIGVSASTVRNRIARLEADGVLRGYHPDIDYERAGYQLHMVFICCAPVEERTELVAEAMGVEGVVTVREMLTGSANVHIEAVGADSEMVDRISTRLTNIGLEIETTDVVKTLHRQPFNHFGTEPIDGE